MDVVLVSFSDLRFPMALVPTRHMSAMKDHLRAMQRYQEAERCFVQWEEACPEDSIERAQWLTQKPTIDVCIEGRDGDACDFFSRRMWTMKDVHVLTNQCPVTEENPCAEFVVNKNFRIVSVMHITVPLQ